MFEHMDRMSKPLILSLAIVLLGVIGVTDYLTGYEISLSSFYLAPILLVAWGIHRRAGIGMSLAGAGCWLLADYFSGHTYSNPVILYWNALVRLSFFLVAVFSLSALKSYMDREKVVARMDFLTGIPNGKAFYEAAEAEIMRSRSNPYPISLAYLDCDNFKTINDERGHQAGDAVLREVAEIIKKNVRASDVGARMGGDEFVLLMPQIGAEAARQAIARMQARLTEAMTKQGWPITFSIGLATFLAPPASADEMIKRSDTLMYLVKQAGKQGLKHEVIG